MTGSNDPQMQPPPQEDEMTLMTVDEVVDLLGLTERTVRQWIADEKLAAVRIGDGKRPIVRVRRRDVLALMKPHSGSATPKNIPA